MKEQNNKKFHKKIFVFFSLLIFVAFFLLYMIINGYFVFHLTNDHKIDKRKDTFYLNKKFKNNDPYLTKNPSLKDMIVGPIITDNDPYMGDKNAPVVIVEFGDYECGFCSKQEQIFKKLMADKKYNVGLVWKDYPERDDAAPSFRAAVAARCAGEQDKFWQYHGILFDHKNDLNEEVFLTIARQLKLDIKSFKECLNNDAPRRQIIDNMAEADALNIKGVPFIYINDQEIMGQANLDDIKRIIELQVNKEQQSK